VEGLHVRLVDDRVLEPEGIAGHPVPHM
jgi:hypothetical protein